MEPVVAPESVNVPFAYGLLTLRIINTVAKRGGFNADEFRVVGELHDFLKKELKVEELARQEAEKQKLESVPEEEEKKE